CVSLASLSEYLAARSFAGITTLYSRFRPWERVSVTFMAFRMGAEPQGPGTACRLYAAPAADFGGGTEGRFYRAMGGPAQAGRPSPRRWRRGPFSARFCSRDPSPAAPGRCAGTLPGRAA